MITAPSFFESLNSSLFAHLALEKSFVQRPHELHAALLLQKLYSQWQNCFVLCRQRNLTKYEADTMSGLFDMLCCLKEGYIGVTGPSRVVNFKSCEDNCRTASSSACNTVCLSELCHSRVADTTPAESKITLVWQILYLQSHMSHLCGRYLHLQNQKPQLCGRYYTCRIKEQWLGLQNLGLQTKHSSS